MTPEAVYVSHGGPRFDGTVTWFVVQTGPLGLEREVLRLREGGRMVLKLRADGVVQTMIGGHRRDNRELYRRLHCEPRESLISQAERDATGSIARTIPQLVEVPATGTSGHFAQPKNPGLWARFVAWFDGNDLDDCNCHGKDET